MEHCGVYRPNFTYNFIAVQNSASALLSWALVSRKIAIQQHIFDIIISYNIMTCAQLGKVIFSANTYVKVVWMVAPLFSPFFTLKIRTTNETWKTTTLLWEIYILRKVECSFKMWGRTYLRIFINNSPAGDSQHCTEDPWPLNTKWLLGFQQRESFTGTVCPHYRWAWAKCSL